jgi:hypothetical protein
LHWLIKVFSHEFGQFKNEAQILQQPNCYGTMQMNFSATCFVVEISKTMNELMETHKATYQSVRKSAIVKLVTQLDLQIKSDTIYLQKMMIQSKLI